MFFKKKKSKKDAEDNKSLFVDSQRFPVDQAIEEAMDLDFGIEKEEPAFTDPRLNQPQHPVPSAVELLDSLESLKKPETDEAEQTLPEKPHYNAPLSLEELETTETGETEAPIAGLPQDMAILLPEPEADEVRTDDTLEEGNSLSGKEKALHSDAPLRIADEAAEPEKVPEHEPHLSPSDEEQFVTSFFPDYTQHKGESLEIDDTLPANEEARLSSDEPAIGAEMERPELPVQSQDEAFPSIRIPSFENKPVTEVITHTTVGSNNPLEVALNALPALDVKKTRKKARADEAKPKRGKKGKKSTAVEQASPAEVVIPPEVAATSAEWVEHKTEVPQEPVIIASSHTVEEIPTQPEETPIEPEAVIQPVDDDLAISSATEPVAEVAEAVENREADRESLSGSSNLDISLAELPEPIDNDVEPPVLRQDEPVIASKPVAEESDATPEPLSPIEAGKKVNPIEVTLNALLPGSTKKKKKKGASQKQPKVVPIQEAPISETPPPVVIEEPTPEAAPVTEAPLKEVAAAEPLPELPVALEEIPSGETPHLESLPDNEPAIEEIVETITASVPMAEPLNEPEEMIATPVLEMPQEETPSVEQPVEEPTIEAVTSSRAMPIPAAEEAYFYPTAEAFEQDEPVDDWLQDEAEPVLAEAVSVDIDTNEEPATPAEAEDVMPAIPVEAAAATQPASALTVAVGELPGIAQPRKVGSRMPAKPSRVVAMDAQSFELFGISERKHTPKPIDIAAASIAQTALPIESEAISLTESAVVEFSEPVTIENATTPTGEESVESILPEPMLALEEEDPFETVWNTPAPGKEDDQTKPETVALTEIDFLTAFDDILIEESFEPAEADAAAEAPKEVYYPDEEIPSAEQADAETTIELAQTEFDSDWVGPAPEEPAFEPESEAQDEQDIQAVEFVADTREAAHFAETEGALSEPEDVVPVHEFPAIAPEEETESLPVIEETEPATPEQDSPEFDAQALELQETPARPEMAPEPEPLISAEQAETQTEENTGTINQPIAEGFSSSGLTVDDFEIDFDTEEIDVFDLSEDLAEEVSLYHIPTPSSITSPEAEAPETSEAEPPEELSDAIGSQESSTSTDESETLPEASRKKLRLIFNRSNSTIETISPTTPDEPLPSDSTTVIPFRSRVPESKPIDSPEAFTEFVQNLLGDTEKPEEKAEETKNPNFDIHTEPDRLTLVVNNLSDEFANLQDAPDEAVPEYSVFEIIRNPETVEEAPQGTEREGEENQTSFALTDVKTSTEKNLQETEPLHAPEEYTVYESIVEDNDASTAPEALELEAPIIEEDVPVAVETETSEQAEINELPDEEKPEPVEPEEEFSIHLQEMAFVPEVAKINDGLTYDATAYAVLDDDLPDAPEYMLEAQDDTTDAASDTDLTQPAIEVVSPEVEIMETEIFETEEQKAIQPTFEPERLSQLPENEETETTAVEEQEEITLPLTDNTLSNFPNQEAVEATEAEEPEEIALTLAPEVLFNLPEDDDEFDFVFNPSEEPPEPLGTAMDEEKESDLADAEDEEPFDIQTTEQENVQPETEQLEIRVADEEPFVAWSEPLNIPSPEPENVAEEDEQSAITLPEDAFTIDFDLQDIPSEIKVWDESAEAEESPLDAGEMEPIPAEMGETPATAEETPIAAQEIETPTAEMDEESTDADHATTFEPDLHLEMTAAQNPIDEPSSILETILPLLPPEPPATEVLPIAPAASAAQTLTVFNTGTNQTNQYFMVQNISNPPFLAAPVPSAPVEDAAALIDEVLAKSPYTDMAAPVVDVAVEAPTPQETVETESVDDIEAFEEEVASVAEDEENIEEIPQAAPAAVAEEPVTDEPVYHVSLGGGLSLDSAELDFELDLPASEDKAQPAEVTAETQAEAEDALSLGTDDVDYFSDIIGSFEFAVDLPESLTDEAVIEEVLPVDTIPEPQPLETEDAELLRPVAASVSKPQRASSIPLGLLPQEDKTVAVRAGARQYTVGNSASVPLFTDAVTYVYVPKRQSFDMADRHGPYYQPDDKALSALPAGTVDIQQSQAESAAVEMQQTRSSEEIRMFNQVSSKIEALLGLPSMPPAEQITPEGVVSSRIEVLLGLRDPEPHYVQVVSEDTASQPQEASAADVSQPQDEGGYRVYQSETQPSLVETSNLPPQPPMLGQSIFPLPEPAAETQLAAPEMTVPSDEAIEEQIQQIDITPYEMGSQEFLTSPLPSYESSLPTGFRAYNWEEEDIVFEDEALEPLQPTPKQLAHLAQQTQAEQPMQPIAASVIPAEQHAPQTAQPYMGQTSVPQPSMAYAAAEPSLGVTGGNDQPPPFTFEDTVGFDMFDFPEINLPDDFQFADLPTPREMPQPMETEMSHMPSDMASQPPQEEASPMAPMTIDGIDILAMDKMLEAFDVMVVHHEGVYALMVDNGQNATMLKLFESNPLEHSAYFKVNQEAMLGMKILFIVHVGHWQGIIAIDGDDVKLQAEF